MSSEEEVSKQGFKKHAIEDRNVALKKRVDELERVLNDLVPPGTPPEDPALKIKSYQRWGGQVLLGLIIILAAIPSTLVIFDRWENRNFSSEILDTLWCMSEFLCYLGLPKYFLLIFICMIIVLVLVWLWRKEPMVVFSNLSLGQVYQDETEVSPRQKNIGTICIALAGFIFILYSLPMAFFTQQIPGWDMIIVLILYATGWILRELHTTKMFQYMKENHNFILALGLFHISLCTVLLTLFSNDRPYLIVIFLFVGACVYLAQFRKRIPIVFWIMTIALVIFAWRLNDWQYTVVGDEYSFFYAARDRIQNQNLIEIGNSLFEGKFVYGTHPYFSSLIHSIFMGIFDNRNFGWRFSNPYLSAIGLLFFYYFFKAFFTRRVALSATFILGVSHYLISFSKIGYNNLQALFAMGLVLATATWALRSMRYVAYMFLGLSIGLCFYVYPAAIYVLPLPFLILILYAPPTSKPNIFRWGIMLLSIILLVFPLIPQPEYWRVKIYGTFYYNPELVSSAAALLQHTVENLIYSFFSFLYIPQESHFVSTAYMDPLSAALLLIGMTYMIKLLFRRNRTVVFVILSYILFLFFVGTSHDRQFPTATRMYLFLPWFSLFAGIGLVWLRETLSHTFDSRWIKTRLLSFMAVLLLGFNLYASYSVDISRSEQYHQLHPLLLRTMRQVEQRPGISVKTYVFVTDPSWNVDGVNFLVDVYQVPPSKSQVEMIVVDSPQIPEAHMDTLSDPDNVIILKPWFNHEWKIALEEVLIQSGRTPCDIQTTGGEIRFQIWHLGDLQWLCQQ